MSTTFATNSTFRMAVRPSSSSPAGGFAIPTKAPSAYGRNIHAQKRALLGKRLDTNASGAMRTVSRGSMLSITAMAHNFAPASTRDEIVHGCESPGSPGDGAKSSAETVNEWMEFMESQGIKRVVCLMSADELERFEVNLLETYASKMTDVTLVNMKSEGAADQLSKAYKEACSAQEKVVTHCVGGQMRTGIALGSWIAKEYNLSPEEATEELLACSKENDADRKCSGDKLEDFLAQ